MDGMVPWPENDDDHVAVWMEAATCATAQDSRLPSYVAGAKPEADPSRVVAEDEAAVMVEALAADEEFTEL